MNEPAGQGQFTFSFPVHFLVSRSSITVNDEGVADEFGPKTRLIGGKTAAANFIAVFTTRDLADRCIQAHGLSDVAVISIGTPELLLRFMINSPRRPTHVGFNPNPTGASGGTLMSR